VAKTVQAAFDQFFAEINLPGDHRETANKRRDRIVGLLSNKLNVLDAFASGSIPRYTALKEKADLDVIVVLHYGRHVKDKKPSEVLQTVRDALSDYRTSLRRNGQAVTLCYETWPNVDVVPVSRVVNDDGSVDYYNIPDMHTETWLPSRPRRHSTDIEDRSSSCGPSFRKIIKMLKHWNERKGGLLQSYHVEVIALKTFSATLSDMPWDVYSYFNSATTLAAGSLWHEAGFVDSYLDFAARNTAVAMLAGARDIACTAWYKTYGTNADHQGAIQEWRKIFGSAFPVYG